eukprot:CAMPEP_0178444660 /NCGR_PEP_ID=MMETSP0689_2-20121128/39661_1 /TAXON_ID=160604 /ORGANISM="Amphidinium massartii, Strain CS-259" /LENGTH=39 /DNA_ID= /DNA_START= /DNA_END= /DNA_ORIENTATION=
MSGDSLLSPARKSAEPECLGRVTFTMLGFASKQAAPVPG